MNSSNNWKHDTRKHFRDRGRIHNLATLNEVENMATMHGEQQKNREAESAWVRRNLWGQEDNEEEAGDEMKQTILGDITNPTPIVVTGNNSSLGQMLLPLVLGAAMTGVPAAGIAGAALTYFLNRPTAEQQAQPDETVSIGLGKIEDLLKDQ